MCLGKFYDNVQRIKKGIRCVIIESLGNSCNCLLNRINKH